VCWAIKKIKYVCYFFQAVDYSFSCWPFGNFWCKSVQYLIICTAYLSIYTLVLMSLDRYAIFYRIFFFYKRSSFDRYLAVVFPVSRVRNERNTIVAIIILWIVVLVANLPVFHVHGITEFYDHHMNRSITSCIYLNDNDFMTWSTFHISFFLFSYLLPFIFISILYFFMLLRLWKSNLTQSLESKRGKKRVTRLVLVIVSCFGVLWLPIQTILLLKSLGWYQSTSHLTVALQIIAHIIAYISACVNPILYAFLSENFRKSFRKVRDANSY
jgi:allatostatin receptor